MLVRVNDVGLVPDGRFVEHASIAAESSVLTDPDGNLRATDVGKNIAVPGAIDLVALIAELVDQKKVANASMDAGSSMTSNILTAVFATGEKRFRADLHEKQRITVAGAGPGGETLVSDVVKVKDGNTLILADAAATTVTGAEAILNRPDRVALDDHARASANNVTVKLGDRIIDDGSMIIGGRGLESPTARFSSLDLKKKVMIRGAGLLVTTIQSFQTSGQVTLAQSAKRAASGLADVWNTDSRPAFEKLLAALDSSDVEGAEIKFGPGVYDFTGGSPHDHVAAAMSLIGLRNLTLRGAGPGATVLRQMPDQDLSGHDDDADTQVIHALDCKKLTIRDLSVHGSYLTLAKVNEQTHGILIGAGCEEVVIDRVEVFQSSGDGIRLVGKPKPDEKVRKIWINGCRLIQNKRTGIGFQQAVEFAWIRDCYIEATPPATDDGIHFEPSGKVGPTDIIIDGNVLVQGTDEAAVTIEGIDGAHPALRVKFVNNTLQGGGIQGQDAQDVTVANNTILAGEQGPVVIFRGACSGLRFCDNKIVAAGRVRTALRIESLKGFTSSSLRIESNHIETPGSGIEITEPGSHFEIRGNRIFGGPFAEIGIGVHLDPPRDNPPPVVHRDFRLIGNTIRLVGDTSANSLVRFGIRLSTSNTQEQFEGVAIHGNNVSIDMPGATVPPVGIGFPHDPVHGGADRWLSGLIVSDNLLGTLHTKIDRDSVTVPFVPIAGNIGDCTIFEGAGSPEGVVRAAIGSLFLRKDAGINTALYVKQSGTAATGWVEILRAGTASL